MAIEVYLSPLSCARVQYVHVYTQMQAILKLQGMEKLVSVSKIVRHNRKPTNQWGLEQLVKNSLALNHSPQQEKRKKVEPNQEMMEAPVLNQEKRVFTTPNYRASSLGRYAAGPNKNILTTSWH